MDWGQIFLNCVIWVIGVVVFFAGLYAIIFIPLMLVLFVIAGIYNIFRLFFPSLPTFWNSGIGGIISGGLSESSSPKKSFDWGEKTEADKHRDLVEHIRIQQMNEERRR